MSRPVVCQHQRRGSLTPSKKAAVRVVVVVVVAGGMTAGATGRLRLVCSEGLARLFAPRESQSHLYGTPCVCSR